MDVLDPEPDALEPIRRYRLCQAAFALVAAGLIFPALDVGLHLGMLISLPRPGLFQVVQHPLYGWVVVLPRALALLAGGYLFWGRWANPAWLRRSGLLVVLGLGDLALWAVEHQEAMGLGVVPDGSEWLRLHLARAIGWGQLVLLTGLSSAFLEHLDDPRVGPRPRQLPGLLSFGVFLWIVYFVRQTDWAGGWPFSQRMAMHPLSLLLLTVYLFLFILAALQLAAVALVGWRESRALARALEAALPKPDDRLLRSRSELEFDEELRSRGG